MVTAQLSQSLTQQLAERVGSVMVTKTPTIKVEESHVSQTGLEVLMPDSAAAAVDTMVEEVEDTVAAPEVLGVTLFAVEEAAEAIVEHRPTARKKLEETRARTVGSSSQGLLVIAAETEKEMGYSGTLDDFL